MYLMSVSKQIARNLALHKLIDQHNVIQYSLLQYNADKRNDTLGILGVLSSCNSPSLMHPLQFVYVGGILNQQSGVPRKRHLLRGGRDRVRWIQEGQLWSNWKTVIQAPWQTRPQVYLYPLKVTQTHQECHLPEIRDTVYPSGQSTRPVERRVRVPASMQAQRSRVSHLLKISLLRVINKAGCDLIQLSSYVYSSCCCILSIITFYKQGNLIILYSL